MNALDASIGQRELEIVHPIPSAGNLWLLCGGQNTDENRCNRPGADPTDHLHHRPSQPDETQPVQPGWPAVAHDVSASAITVQDIADVTLHDARGASKVRR
jgi:hypothetical protein